MNEGNHLNVENSAEAESEKQEGISRRKFLGGLAAMAFVAASSEVEAGIKVFTSGKNSEKEADDNVDIKDQIRGKSEKIDHNIELTPDYKKNLSQLMLTVPDGCTKEKMQDVYSGLFVNLPEYTEIIMVVSEKQLPAIKAVVLEKKLKNKIIYKLSGKNNEDLDIWAQDYGKPIKIDGEDKFLLPCKIDTSNNKYAADDRRRVDDRNLLISESLGAENVKVADFFFQGGNLMFDQAEAGPKAYVGFDVYYATAHNNSGGNELSPKDVVEKISRSLGGAEVVVMGNRIQDESREDAGFIHIDQSFILLDNKTAIVNKMDKTVGKDVRNVHNYYAAQLRQQGYRIIFLENSATDEQLTRSSLNAIPFVDKQTNQKKVIFPVFDNEIIDKSASINAANLQGKASKAYLAFMEAGYLPIPVLDKTFYEKGNLHCITNVLAKNEDSLQEEVA